MITIKENTTLVGVSELRTKMEAILKMSRNHKVVIGRRNRPVAVVMDIKKYDEMERMLDALEDFALGYLAQERERHHPSDYLDLDEAEERIRS